MFRCVAVIFINYYYRQHVALIKYGIGTQRLRGRSGLRHSRTALNEPGANDLFCSECTHPAQ